MANSCKYYKQKEQFSTNSGQTWQDVTPFEYRRGSFIEADSPDCREGTLISRWVTVPDAFLCDGKNKYEKQVGQYSLDNGATWQYYYPSLYQSGNLIEANSEICHNKWEGYYSMESVCPSGYVFVQGRGCVPNKPSGGGGTVIHYAPDPVKYIRCSSTTSTTLTQADITYNNYNKYNSYYPYYGIIGDCVTSIGENAFSGCSSLTSLTIPSNVTSVGNYAFQYCTSLTSVGGEGSNSSIEIADGLTAINYGTFQRCYGLRNVTIPNSVASIGQYVFYRCTGLTSVTLPSGLTSIGNYAFNGCSRLTSVTIPDSVTSIDKYTFEGCSGLRTCSIGSGVISIGTGAFRGCSSLTSLTIPDNVKTVDLWAFSGCTSLVKVMIGSGITSIDNDTFHSCSSLTSVIINATTPPRLHSSSAFDNTNNCPIFVPCDSVNAYKSANWWSNLANRIYCISPAPTGDYKWLATYSNGSIESATCNDSSEIISGDVRLTNLVNVEIGDCVYIIGNYAFDRCSSLTSVTIPDSVLSIRSAAFRNCTSLTSVTIPDSVTDISYVAFSGCSNLTSITINAATPPMIKGNTFVQTNNCPIYVPCNSVNDYKNAAIWSTNYKDRIYGLPPCAQYRWVESGTTCIGYDKYQNNIKQVSTDGINWENVVPAEYSASTLIETHSEDCGYVPSPKWIATYTGGTTSSAECSSSNAITQNEVNLTDLTSVEIKDCVSTLGFRAFKQATSLTSVTMADTVTLISGETFASCTALTSVNLSTGLTTISGSSFQNCPSLTSVTIPASVQRIGSRVFERCSGLTRVTVLATTPPSLASYVFDDTNNCPIYVPCDSVNTYKSASGWSTYASRIVGDCPFSGKWLATYSDSHTESAQCGSSSAITNNEITKSGLTSVEIGDCVTSIGMNVFSGCTNLTSIIIPNSVTSIGNSAFWYCTGLTSVTIPSGVTTIEGGTFYNCDGLTSITIPSGVTSIGNSAFMSCSNIEDITIPNTVTSIGTYVFSNCISLQTVTLPNSITTLPDNTFRECDNLAMINSENIGEFNIPSGVITLGYGLFTSCYALQYLIIPSTVTTIEKNILQGCRNVVIVCNAVNPPALTDTLGGSIAQIRVPSASVEAYKSASGWSQYANKIYPN